MERAQVQQLLLHSSWLILLAALWLLWAMRRPGATRRMAVLMLVPCALYLWMHFVETKYIQIKQATLAGTGITARIALISDIHLGIYKDQAFLQRVVSKLNGLDVDAVVIAGDLTYEPRGQSLRELFAPLAQLKHPTYVVLGNHDQQMPGPDIDAELRQALVDLGTYLIEGELVTTPQGVRLAGLGDNWAGKDDPHFIPADGIPTLVVAHNPDSAMRLTPQQAALVLSGHTHGGQIRIPILYRHAIPSRYGFDRGEAVAQTAAGPVRVYISAGIGEVGLPLRLFNPAAIDVLDLKP